MSQLINKNGYRKLTKEQREFYDAVCMRAISAQYGSPYLRAMIASLYPVATEEVPTFAVDQRGRIYINFPRVMELGVEWAAGGVIHEAWHVLLAHFDRKKQGFTDNSRWGIASDIEINQNLPMTSQEVMREIHYPKTHGLDNNLTAERYYELLPVPQTKDSDEKSDKSGQDGSGSGEGSPSGGDSQDGEGQSGSGDGKGNSQSQSDSGSKSGSGQGQGQPNDKSLGDCGSGQDGKARPYEVGYGDAPQQTPLDQNYVRGEVARAIKKQEASKGIGSVPGFAKLWAEEFLAPPKVRWQQLMRGEIARGMRRMKRGSKVTVPNRPARRQPVEDIMFPKRRGYKLKVAIAVDTSGSNLHHLKYAVSEVLGIVRVADVDEVVMFSVDAHANTPKKIRSARDINFEGGGGTDMRLAFQSFEDCGADIGIILTDSQSPWYSEPFGGKAHVIVGGLISSGFDRSAFDEIPEWLPKVAIEVE